jgi:hypothetical protein
MTSPKNYERKLFLWGGPVHRDRCAGQHGYVIASRAAIGRRLSLMPSPCSGRKTLKLRGEKTILGPLTRRRKALASGARHAAATSLRTSWARIDGRLCCGHS